MTISSDYLEILARIENRIHIPFIKKIILPHGNGKCNKSNFAAIILEDDTIGLFFINLTQEVKGLIKKIKPKEYKGISPTKLALNFSSKDLFEKSLSIGCINAISQYIFKKSNFLFDYTSDSLGLLYLSCHK